MPKINFTIKTKKNTTIKPKENNSITIPSSNEFTIIIDSREQLPFKFPKEITTITKALPSGDYSILSLEDKVAVERKSHQDMYNSLSSGRERFLREMDRLSTFDRAIIIVETSLTQFLKPPTYMRGGYVFESKFNPKSAINSLISIYIKYNVPTVFADSHAVGMCYTLRFLEKYWKWYIERINGK
jgi:ERCC4-type nuclease